LEIIQYRAYSVTVCGREINPSYCGHNCLFCA